MTVMNLDQLEVWKRACDFAVLIYKQVVLHLPAREKYNLTDQLKRAATSIPANIAEGHSRYHYLDSVRFCYSARGSLTEVQSHLSLANSPGYLSDEVYRNITTIAESIAKQLNNYTAYLKRSKQGEKDYPRDYKIREETEINLVCSKTQTINHPPLTTLHSKGTPCHYFTLFF